MENSAMYEDLYEKIEHLDADLLASGNAGHEGETFNLIDEVEFRLGQDGKIGELEGLNLANAKGLWQRHLLRSALDRARHALDTSQYPQDKYDAELVATRKNTSALP
jgi:hypothetical protein